MSRVRPALFAVAAVVCISAFAPAPFPRREARVSDSLSIQALQGGWNATLLTQTGRADKLDARSNGVNHVTVTPTQWIFNKNQGETVYDLRIDTTKKPAEIDFRRVGQQEPYGRGIIKRQGNTIRLIYNWGEPRPTGFENQPTGYWDLTLQRE